MSEPEFCAGISHVTLLVRDLARSGAMLESVLGARLVYDSGEKTFSRAPERFYLVGGAWICLMQGEPRPDEDYEHVAFSVSEDALPLCGARIRALGLSILPGRPRVMGEGRSVYFRDYDAHLFELHTGTLAMRLSRYAQEPDGGEA